MSLIPGSKYYQCINCGLKFLINSWVMAPFVLIFYLIKFIIWVAWDFSGIRFWGQTICPPAGPSHTKRAPSTFLLWVIGVLAFYVTLFGIAQQGYNNRIGIIENRMNTILSQLSIPNEIVRKNAIDMIPKVQNMPRYDKPNLYEPISVMRYFFKSPEQPYEAINEILKTTVENFKDQLDSVNLTSANLRDANLHGANLSRADLSHSNLSGIRLSYADLRGTDFSNSNLSGADLRGADLYAAVLHGANLQGADLRSIEKSEFPSSDMNLTADEFPTSRSVIIDQLSKTLTLYQTKLDPDIEREIKRSFAHLFEPPEMQQKMDNASAELGTARLWENVSIFFKKKTDPLFSYVSDLTSRI